MIKKYGWSYTLDIGNVRYVISIIRRKSGQKEEKKELREE